VTVFGAAAANAPADMKEAQTTNVMRANMCDLPGRGCAWTLHGTERLPSSRGALDDQFEM
jgi:hypothetical protein